MQDDRPDDHAIPAGSFSGWLRGFEEARDVNGTSEVPCGDCTACCRASHFIHIAPDERRTIARIPRMLLAPAPGLPAGHRVLGFDQHGHCPMLVDGSCSIYTDRPRTCRTYDCRVFAATGVADPSPTKVEITQRAERWTFDHPTADDSRRHDAARAAGQFLVDRASELPEGLAPTSPTQLAVAALELHELFLDRDPNQVDASAVSARLEAIRRRG